MQDVLGPAGPAERSSLKPEIICCLAIAGTGTGTGMCGYRNFLRTEHRIYDDRTGIQTHAIASVTGNPLPDTCGKYLRVHDYGTGAGPYDVNHHRHRNTRRLRGLEIYCIRGFP